VTIAVTEANGEAERQAALDMLDDLKAKHQCVLQTMGADMGYDDGEFFQEWEDRPIEPHARTGEVEDGATSEATPWHSGASSHEATPEDRGIFAESEVPQED